MHKVKIQWCGSCSDDLPITSGLWFKKTYFTVRVMICYVLLSSFYVTREGSLLFVFHWYNSSATKNPKEGTGALTRGGLIDKPVAAKPALANCLSNALINQTEEKLWQEGCHCFHDFLPLTSQCETWLCTQTVAFKAVLMPACCRAHLALVGWGPAQLWGMISPRRPI